ncbi:Flp pilus assembly complex ATPase component TadA [Candidatus Woesearchaeota archaeon]|nr:Flp pilus assembly complex ATPase component TadA [Candidatus Woesearchaeota archaeon]
MESLKVASALASPGSEVDASTGIRSTLRMGDSALFVGEVRSKEAIALFEAMRVGAAANVVAGTIHAASPYGVYDRVVNDIGVPKTSFKAIDIIVQSNPIKSASGLKKYKRVLGITEVRKEWEDDPLKEGAFVDLMIYNAETDELEVTDDLKNGNSDVLKQMAGRIKEFAGDWDAVWNNIQLRADYKKAIVDVYDKIKDPALMEAPFVIACNDKFHLLSDKVKEEVGSLDPKRILFEFKEWLKKEVKQRKM